MPYFQNHQGLSIFYKIFPHRASSVLDRKAAPNLVLLHGLSSSHGIWEPQIPALTRYFNVYALDFPGHGNSEHSPHYSHRLFANTVWDALSFWQLEKAHVMGLSIGGNVAMMLASDYPDRIQSLVVQGPSGGIAPPWTLKGQIKRGLVYGYLGLLWLLWKTVGVDKTSWIVNQFGVQTYDFYEALYRLERQVDPFAVRDITLENIYPPYHGKLAAIQCPVAIIRGKGDLFPCRYIRHLKRHLPQSQYFELAGGRHAVAIEVPDQYNATVLNFYHQNGFIEFKDLPQSAVLPITGKEKRKSASFSPFFGNSAPELATK